MSNTPAIVFIFIAIYFIFLAVAIGIIIQAVNRLIDRVEALEAITGASQAADYKIADERL